MLDVAKNTRHLHYGLITVYAKPKAPRRVVYFVAW